MDKPAHDTTRDDESNRLTGRLQRYARVGTGLAGVATSMLGRRAMGGGRINASDAAQLARALGSMKGPLMKVAQLLSTIPDAVPPEYAEELAKLQAEAPPMGWAFVKRRMRSELGPDWQARFAEFGHDPVAAASLGQVHKAQLHDGRAVAAKLQYPDMASAVEADLSQLSVMMSVFRRMDTAIDTSEIEVEIGERVREELDYGRERAHIDLYRNAFAASEYGDLVRIPEPVEALSTRRLLTMQWLEGEKMLAFKGENQEVRNRLATAMFRAWWHPFATIGVIHGDPHLGNYTVFRDDKGAPSGINLLDFGCIRIFPPTFVSAVIDLYEGLIENDEARTVHAYETWGFKNLRKDLIEVLNVWARFIYGPLMDDRVRTIADGVSPGQYGRREAFTVHQELKKKGPVTIPREFVFMDRAAIGLGSVFLHLDARMNFFRLFQSEIENYDEARLAMRQNNALEKVGLKPNSAASA